nr:RNA polymerase sigma-24 subunit [uncultured bacterium]
MLDAARAGSPDALSELWRRYAPGVTAFARSRGAGEPDEVASDCFLAVFEKLGRFRGSEPDFRAFLYTVAHRRVVDDHRRRSGGVPVRALIEGDEGPAQPSAEETVMHRSGTAHAWHLLSLLTPDQRDVVALRIFGELTLEEVASVLGKGTGAVKALQRRGLDSLRRMLEDGASGAHDEVEGGRR